MATDLSKLIQEGITSTLTGILGRDTSFNEITKVDARDINHFEFLQVNAEFAFDKLTSLFEFFIPATSASIIFNTMMSAEDYDISSTIDDDTSDAMTEFVSNLSGSLVTAFNAEDIEELGASKFNIQHKEILTGDAITNIDNLFRFSLNIEETPILIFIKFHEEFLPFIPNIANSEFTFYPEEKEAPEEEDLEPTPKIEETINEDIDEVTTVKKDTNQEEENTVTNDTKSKLNLLLTKRNKIILAGVAGVIILLLVIMSIFSSKEVPEEEPVVKQEVPQKVETQEVQITPYKTLKKVDFSIKDIDVDRLNTRLSTLTKYQVLSEQEIKAQEIAEKVRLAKLQKERELIAFAKLNKEEPIKQIQKKEKEGKITTPAISNATKIQEKKVKTEITPTTKQLTAIPATVKKPISVSSFYLTTYSIKYTLYKNLILENNAQNARISICNDAEGRTSIFIGPFKTNIEQMKMKTLIEKANPAIDTNLLQITQEEFDQKCNF
jgi:hypothetical protein